MTIMYLTTDEIVQIHDTIIEETGGHSGIISYGNLDFISNQAKIPKTIERAATILFYGILTSHPLVDGNKRTAIASLETFLKENDKEIIASDKELWEVVHSISEGKLKFEETVNWIKKNIK